MRNGEATGFGGRPAHASEKKVQTYAESRRMKRSAQACEHPPVVGSVKHKTERRHGGSAGFTLIELLVVLAIVALLLTLAVPRYFQSIERSKETILVENLNVTRDTIDKFYADQGRYPESLQELVQKKYLRNMPFDPITDSAETWVIVPPDDSGKGNVYNIRSGAEGSTYDGKPFAEL